MHCWVNLKTIYKDCIYIKKYFMESKAFKKRIRNLLTVSQNETVSKHPNFCAPAEH